MTEEPEKKNQQRPQHVKSAIIDPFDVSSSKTSFKDANKIEEKSTPNSPAKNKLAEAIQELSKKEKQTRHSHDELLNIMPVLLIVGMLLFGIAFAGSYKSSGNLVLKAGERFADKTEELIQYSSLAASVGASSLVRMFEDLEQETPMSSDQMRTTAGTPVAKSRMRIMPESFSPRVIGSIIQTQTASVQGVLKDIFSW